MVGHYVLNVLLPRQYKKGMITMIDELVLLFVLFAGIFAIYAALDSLRIRENKHRIRDLWK